MRHLNLCTETGALVENASEILAAFTYFHDDTDMRRQALLLASDERLRYLKIGPEEWAPTPLSLAASAWASKKQGRVTVCGYTVLAFLLLLERGNEQPSLYAATKVVSKALAAYKKLGPNARPLKSFRFDGEWSLNDLSAPSSPEDIRKAYKEFEPVAHLCAAEVVCTEHFLAMHLFNRTPETLTMALHTAARIEQVLIQRVPDHFKNPWSVIGSMPGGFEDFPPAYPQDETRAFLETGL